LGTYRHLRASGDAPALPQTRPSPHFSDSKFRRQAGAWPGYGVVPATAAESVLHFGLMPAVLSGVILVAVFAAMAVLAGFLGMTAFRRAGSREVTHSRDQPLS
jgi:hypothetical protein